VRLLITGGAGFIGSHLVRACLEAGDEVRILDNFSTGSVRNLEGIASDVDVYKGSIVDPDAPMRAARDCDVIFHCAAVASVARSIEDPVGTAAVNTTGTLHVLEAGRRAGVRKVVFASSAAVYGDDEALPKAEDMPARPRSPYALHKWTGEHYCEQFSRLYGLETISLRYFNVYGPRQDPASEYSGVISRFVTAAVFGQAPRIYGDGQQTRDFVYVSDVAAATRAAALAASDSQSEVVNIGAGRSFSLLELLTLIAGALDQPVLEPFFEAARSGDLRHSRADISKAERLLGWSPRVPVEAGLRETVRYYREASE
jgi:UDP-glucose 4-epimerase